MASAEVYIILDALSRSSTSFGVMVIYSLSIASKPSGFVVKRIIACCELKKFISFFLCCQFRFRDLDTLRIQLLLTFH